jgi:hypothetical protein
MEEFAVRTSGWSSLPTSDATWDEGRARAALNDWAGDDMAKYGRAFLWSDGSGTKDGFKFPIAMPVGGKLTVFRNAVNNAKARMNQATDIPSDAKQKMMGVLNSLQASYSRDSMTASAAPVSPPKVWFNDPKLPGKTKITVTPEGRVFGHLGTWDSCHLTFANTCVTVPRSRRNYADFHVGSTKTAEGDVIDTGVLTVDTGHADTAWSMASKVKAHYDNTGAKAAVVRAGEDQFGVWVAGALAPGADVEEMAQKLRQAPLSGDWRKIGGSLELVAALGVNRPGFAITAAGESEESDEVFEGIEFHVEDDEVTCLIASADFADADVYIEQSAAADEEVDCGCPDKANLTERLNAHAAPLLTASERERRVARIAGYAKI